VIRKIHLEAPAAACPGRRRLGTVRPPSAERNRVYEGKKVLITAASASWK
jgi:hypothetical protein